MVRYLKDKAEYDAALELSSTKLVIIDFTATWCGPCQYIGPIFEKLAEENPEAEFVKVDVDDNDTVAAACGISAMPTFQCYKDGKKVDEMRGADQKALLAMIVKHK